MELRHLRYFAAVVETESFTRAAEQMLIAQPAMSKQILDLERELGTTLFVRGAKGVSITAAGSRFYSDAKEILRLSEESVENARRAANGEIGSLSIGFFSSPTARFLAALVNQYKSKYPSVSIKLHELNPNKLLAGLIDGSLDIAFNRPVDVAEGNLLGKVELFKEQIKAVVPLNHRLNKKIIKIEEIRGENLVLLQREAAAGLFDQITSFCLTNGFSPRVSATAERMSTVLTLVASGLGIGLVPETVQNIDYQGLHFMQIKPKAPLLSLECQWLKPLHSPTTRAFLAILQEAKPVIAKSFIQF